MAKLSESVGSLKMRVPLIKVILSIVVLVRGGSENGVVVSSPSVTSAKRTIEPF